MSITNGICITMDIAPDDEASISSEEDIATESDFEGRVRAKPIQQEVWNGEEVREVLMSLSGAESIIEQLTNDEKTPVLDVQEVESLLLLSAWLGNEKGVKFALEHGQDPNLVDPEGR